MRRLLILGVLVSATYVACGDDDGGNTPPPAGAAGTGGEAAGGEASGGAALGGSGPSTGGDGGASSQLGGTGGVERGGESSENTGGFGAGGEGMAAEGGASGAPDGSAGSPEQPPVPLNGCLEFVDGRAAAELRVIPWGYSLGLYPVRCLLVQVGQAVTWEGAFGSHPIQPAGGTMPSPIIGDTLSDQTSYDVTFNALGTYGYVCGLHTGMRGAIRVME